MTRWQGGKVTEATAEVAPITLSPPHAVTLSRPRRRWPLIAAACALLTLGPLAYFYGGTVIRVVTNTGVLVIDVADGAKIAVTIKDGAAHVYDKARGSST